MSYKFTATHRPGYSSVDHIGPEVARAVTDACVRSYPSLSAARRAGERAYRRLGREAKRHVNARLAADPNAVIDIYWRRFFAPSIVIETIEA
jgi:hypothetical protein